MSEEAKAIQEVAKTTSKAIEASEKLGGFLDRILGKGFAELGAAFADWAQSYRYTNLLKLIDKIDAIHESRKLEGKIIPLLPKHTIQILEYASLEDDEVLNGMWAGLIANATDPNRKFQINKLFIGILSSLDPIDAEILQYLSRLPEHNPIARLPSINNINASRVSDDLGLSYEDCLLSLSNLARLSLLKDGWEQTVEMLDFGTAGFSVDNYRSNFSLSFLGRSLISGCEAA